MKPSKGKLFKVSYCDIGTPWCEELEQQEGLGGSLILYRGAWGDTTMKDPFDGVFESFQKIEIVNPTNLIIYEKDKPESWDEKVKPRFV